MLYLFYGSDEFSMSEAIADLKRQLPPEVLPLNYTSLEGRKLKLDDLARACEAVPFLADRRVVVVRDALKQTRAGKERDELRDYLQHVPACCDLVFAERDTVDRRSSLYTYLKKHGQVQEFQPRQGAELLRWINERARLLDGAIKRDAAQRLVEYAGNDSRTLATELEKLATYAGRDSNITAPMVDLLVQDSHEHNLFAFLDDLSQRNPQATLGGLRGLLADGQAPAYLLFMLMRQVRILLGVQELAAQRMRPDEIASQLGQKPFVVRKALGQMDNFRPEELRHLHDRLLATDQAIKTGQLRAEVALEMLVLEICGVS
jgi:DNA polymerase-3 subunit delta